MQFRSPNLSSLLASDQRQRLLNAIVFFVTNTKRCHTLKLFKLLFFLDFEHYRQTGRTVTGLEYIAWPNGPAPSDLWDELRSPPADLRAVASVVPVHDDITSKLLRRDIKPKKAFDRQLFSKRELRIMTLIADVFAEAKADDMSEFSHLKGSPWHHVYNGGKGNGRMIPVELSRRTPPVLPTLPSLDDEEYEYRKSVFAGIDGGNGG